MKRLSTGVLAALLAAGLGLGAVAAPLVSQAQGNSGNTVVAQASIGTTPAADFGTPPSGQVPILYNDHHVYSKPDVLKQRRVLAALVKGGTVLIPLRSMFEQMGASVSYDAASKTVTVTKPGAEVKVTVGKPEVMINGESRPLDVPPMLYKGSVLVPLRVISEGMGAYVKWVSDKQLVVVRYIPPTPMPTPMPTAMPTAEPTVAPTATPVPLVVPTPSYNGFVQAAIWAPKSYNEFSAGQYCRESYLASAVYAPQNSKFAAKVDFRQYSFVTSSNITDAYGNQYTQFATIDGGTAVTPVFLGRQNSIDARLEYQIASPRVYVGVGYVRTSNNYGYPQLHAVGFGVEKLPDLRPGVSVYGSAFYYPSASGSYTVTNPASSNFGTSYRQQYNITKYDVGLALVMKHSPIYLYGGFAADQYSVKQNAPIGQTHNGPYIGLGVKL